MLNTSNKFAARPTSQPFDVRPQQLIVSPYTPQEKKKGGRNGWYWWWDLNPHGVTTKGF